MLRVRSRSRKASTRGLANRILGTRRGRRVRPRGVRHPLHPDRSYVRSRRRSRRAGTSWIHSGGSEGDTPRVVRGALHPRRGVRAVPIQRGHPRHALEFWPSRQHVRSRPSSLCERHGSSVPVWDIRAASGHPLLVSNAAPGRICDASRQRVCGCEATAPAAAHRLDAVKTAVYVPLTRACCRKRC